MRSSLTSHVALAGLVAGLASIIGCSSPPAGPSIFGGTGGSSGSGNNSSGTGGSASGTGGSASGTGGSASGTGGSASGTGGSASGTGGSASGTGGTTGTGGTAGNPDAGGTGGMPPADGGGTGGMVGGGQITAARPTAGCGKAPTGTGQQTIMTMGMKPANCADTGGCGAWSWNRSYNVILPAGYMNTKAYPLVFQGGGCGAGDTGVYPLGGAADAVIRVGIAPPEPRTANTRLHHATNPGQGCFDDKEGDDSVDWVFYENLWDRLADQICFDQNRVFASGNSSGAWFSNEVGCKYAGDAKHPIRGIMPNTGGLPSQPMYEPTCTNNPMSGIWMGETMDPENAFSNNIFAIERAMRVNKCTMTTYNAANTDPWPVGGDMTCKKVRGCPELYPLIVCLISGNSHASHDGLANPAFAQYLGLFTKAPFITP